MAHSIELKREIVALLNKGIKAKRIADDYGIAESTIKHFPGELARKEKLDAEYRAAKESVASSVRTAPVSKDAGGFFEGKPTDIGQPKPILGTSARKRDGRTGLDSPANTSTNVASVVLCMMLSTA